MGLFKSSKKAPKETSQTAEAKNVQTPEERVINDYPFVKEMKHIRDDVWNQYDILIDSRPYGWDELIMMADLIAENDLVNISEVYAGYVNDISFTKEFLEKKKLKDVFADSEYGFLSVAGISKRLRNPLKIVWFNQTQILRCFTLTDDEVMMEKYCETALRGIWGTEDEMCLARKSD